MDSRQISSILKTNYHTKKCFRGVYASNNIPASFYAPFSHPFGFVANTDREGKPGTHWVAFYIPNSKTIEYFDSYGHIPNSDIKNFLDHFPNLIENKRKVQAIFETSCGPHVIYFLVQRCRGISFQKILSSLSHPYSDVHVKLFVYKLIRNTFV